MRYVLFTGSLLVLATLLTACDPGIGLKIVNDSDSRLCWYESERSAADRQQPCSAIESGESPTFSIICTPDMARLVIVTVGKGGPRSYEREATCGAWDDAGATVTVRQRGGEFVVEDGFD